LAPNISFFCCRLLPTSRFSSVVGSQHIAFCCHWL
jgi:hypothetical protein